MFFAVKIGWQSPLLTRMYLLGHVYFSQNYKNMFLNYSIALGHTRKTPERQQQMTKVTDLVTPGEQSTKTIVDKFVLPYVNSFEAFEWDLLRPTEAKDTTKDVDWNEWGYGS